MGVGRWEIATIALFPTPNSQLPTPSLFTSSPEQGPWRRQRVLQPCHQRRERQPWRRQPEQLRRQRVLHQRHSRLEQLADELREARIEAESANQAKAELLYSFIDNSSLYLNPVDKACRSRMNVPFFLRDESRNEAFLAGAQARGVHGGAA